MGIAGWTWLWTALAFGLFAGAALWSRARSAADFYVAERPVHPAVSGMATGADWMSAASFMSMAGLLALGGRDGAAYLMGWTGGFVLLAVLLAPTLRRAGTHTVPQFVGRRYYSGAARLVAVLCALVISFTYVAGQLRGVGVVLSRLLGLPVEAAVIVGCLIAFAYAVTGGFKGITGAQVAQYLVIIAAFLIPAGLASLALTGNPIPPLGAGGRLTAQGAALLGGAPGEHLLQALDRAGADLGLGRFTGGSRPVADVLCTTAALMIGTAGLPHIIIRFFTAPSIRDARATAGWALLFIAVLYLSAPAVGAFARAGLVGTLDGRPHAEAPAWFADWERAGLARWTDRDGDGLMRLSGDPARNEVKVDPDVLVLAMPQMVGLPAWVVGLVAAGALAAALGTASGLLLVIAAAVAHDLLRGALLPRMSERAELWSARLAGAAAALGAGWFGLHPPASVAQVVAYAFGFAAASFFPVILLGIAWRRTTREGAVAGMLAGLLLTAGYVTWFALLRPDLDGPAHWWLGVSPEGFGAIGALVNLLVTVAVSLVTPPPPREVQALVASLRTPGPAGG